MAFLFATNRQFELNNKFQDIGRLKQSIFSLLASTGTLDNLVNAPGEVAGNRNGVRVSVVHLPMSGRRFHEVVMAGGDTQDQTAGRMEEVAEKIKRFDFD
jgi:hypothetical protein